MSKHTTTTHTHPVVNAIRFVSTCHTKTKHMFHQLFTPKICCVLGVGAAVCRDFFSCVFNRPATMEYK